MGIENFLKYRIRKSDANQRELVEQMRWRGMQVWQIDEPVDLIVGYQANLAFVEVKNPNGRDRLTPQQEQLRDQCHKRNLPFFVLRHAEDIDIICSELIARRDGRYE